MSKAMRISLFLLGLLLVLSCAVLAQSSEKSLGDAKKVAGTLDAGCRGYHTFCINSQLIDGDALNSAGDCWITYDIRYWNGFTATAGVPDDDRDAGGSVTFETDGVVVKTITQEHGQNPTPIAIPLAGKRTLTIRYSGGWGVLLINPKLTKHPISEGNSSTTTTTGGGRESPSSTSTDGTSSGNSASFVVEPKDIDSLAQQLREKISTKPALKTKLEKARIAIADFDLVDIPSKSVSKNVADDLYTAMIDRDFKLVERGQVGKLLEELKIQSSGMIDPKTAKKIGEICGCDMILLGSISDRGQFLVVNARLMETETGSSVVAQKVEMRKVSINR